MEILTSAVVRCRFSGAVSPRNQATLALASTATGTPLIGAADYPDTKGKAGPLSTEIERIREGVERNRAGRLKVSLRLRPPAVSAPSPEAGYRIVKLLSSVLTAPIRVTPKRVRGVRRELARDVSADSLLVGIALLAGALVRSWPVVFIALPLTGLIAAPATAALAPLGFGHFHLSRSERNATVAGLFSGAPGALVGGSVMGPEIAKLGDSSWMPML